MSEATARKPDWLDQILFPEDGTATSRIFRVIIAAFTIWAFWKSDLSVLTCIIGTAYVLDSVGMHWGGKS